MLAENSSGVKRNRGHARCSGDAGVRKAAASARPATAQTPPPPPLPKTSALRHNAGGLGAQEETP
jgi:hypothetical protein